MVSEGRERGHVGENLRSHLRAFRKRHRTCVPRLPLRPTVRGLLFVVLATLAPGQHSDAQELEPRLYSNVPVGLNFVVAGYAASGGNVLVDQSIQLDDAELDFDGILVGYARSLAVNRMLGKIDAAVGSVCLSGSADYRGERVTRDVCGLTDARIRLAVNFIGAPALTMEEFAASRQDLVVGASVQVAAPVGDYDAARLVNIGANRWAAKAEIGLWKLLTPWTLELSAAGSFFGANDEFFGGRRREQDPLYSLQGHIVRGFGSGLWVAFDMTHYRGGRTTVDGVVNGDRQSNDRVGVTVSVPVGRKHAVKVSMSSGVSTRTGTDFDTYALVWQYRWGAGL